MNERLSVLDLRHFESERQDERERFLRELRVTAQKVGFFYIAGHGIDGDLCNRVLSVARQFFALPLQERLAIDHLLSPQFRGYTRLGDEFRNGRHDVREQIDFGAERPALALEPGQPAYLRLEGPNQWPAGLPQMREVMLPWLSEMAQLGHRVLTALAACLGKSPTYFTDSFIGHPNVSAKMIRYPGHDGSLGKYGAGPHTDYGYVAMLLLEPGSAGLQILEGPNCWREVEPIAGTFVVNMGKMLEVVTNGYLKATIHRVVNPPLGTDRVSVPFFFNPRLDAIVKPMKPTRELPVDADLQPMPGALTSEFGYSALRSWLHAYPDVARRHHADLV